MKSSDYIKKPVIDAFSKVYGSIKNKGIINLSLKDSFIVPDKFWDVLLADDDEDDREIFIEAISEVAPNVKIAAVKNGVELMNRLTQDNAVLPDIIFLDLNMPCKSGEECLMEIRNHESLKDIPVVIYSTSSSKSDIDKTYQGGASYYITKPNSFNDLKTLAQRFFSINWTAKLWKPIKESFVFK
ncbi:MAG: response regulator [Bacteroidota bacterium]|nr:response regulator [Bacteroidota bacterium]